ncbi:MAG TPA: ABC transporter permease [Blastocatellia bacterium]|nr:ABC transporter permease [Blastocatellia bacterium]
MTSPSDERGGFLNSHLWLIKFIGVIVPRRMRADWRQEWEAELRYREELLADWDRLDWRNKLDLLWRSLGAFRDALLLQPRRLEDEMFQDLRFSVRMLLKDKVFTIVAALSLALGIGANTAIFSLIDAALLKSLPVKDPAQLYLITHAGERGVTEANNFPLFERMRDHNQFFSGVIAFNPNRWKVTLNGEAELVSGQVVTGNYFTVLGVNAALGRTLTVEDDKIPKGHPVAVISHAYWRRRFGQDPGVLGKTITINLTPFTIIGVTTPEFFGLQSGRSTEISVPMAMHPLVGSGSNLGDRKFWWNLPILGRLKSGASIEQARAELEVLNRQFLAESGMAPERQKDFFARVELASARNGMAELRKEFSSPLQALMVMVALALLIACANIANLLLSRATARRKEISIRLALGASRVRLVRQLLTESVLLAALGGAFGLFLARWGVQFLVNFIPPKGAPLTLRFSLDARILCFTAAVSMLTGILFGLAPALRATKGDLNAALKDSARSLGGRRTRLGLGNALIVFQIALSLLLLIGAGLFVRSLQKLRRVETGFNSQNHILLFSIDCYGTVYKGAKLAALHQELLGRMNTFPGVRSASLSTASPIVGVDGASRIYLPGSAKNNPNREDEEVGVNVVGPKYFETMGIPLAAGRDLLPQDSEQAPRVAVVSENMARHYFPDENPLGKRFSFGASPQADQYEIVGVVKDAKFGSLRKENMRIVYLSHQQNWTRPSINFALRAAGDPADLITAVRQEIQSVGKDIPVTKLTTLAAQLDETLGKERLVAMISGFFGLLSLVLACIGVYGLLSYAVTRRTNEIGIRMALGASAGNVFKLVMGETLLLVLMGVTLGLAAAMATTRLISSLLFGLTATEPMTMALAALSLTAVAAFAGFLPALRAARVDPLAALRRD